MKDKTAVVLLLWLSVTGVCRGGAGQLMLETGKKKCIYIFQQTNLLNTGKKYEPQKIALMNKKCLSLSNSVCLQWNVGVELFSYNQLSGVGMCNTWTILQKSRSPPVSNWQTFPWYILFDVCMRSWPVTQWFEFHISLSFSWQRRSEGPGILLLLPLFV